MVQRAFEQTRASSSYSVTCLVNWQALALVHVHGIVWIVFSKNTCGEKSDFSGKYSAVRCFVFGFTRRGNIICCSPLFLASFCVV